MGPLVEGAVLLAPESMGLSLLSLGAATIAVIAEPFMETYYQDQLDVLKQSYIEKMASLFDGALKQGSIIEGRPLMPAELDQIKLAAIKWGDPDVSKNYLALTANTVASNFLIHKDGAIQVNAVKLKETMDALQGRKPSEFPMSAELKEALHQFNDKLDDLKKYCEEKINKSMSDLD
jgi:hypothetical protein